MNVAAHAHTPTPKVSVRALDFFYGKTHALKNISLSLRTNKVTAFIGPSGCGKSTLLRVLNRMYDLYPGHRAEGEVLLDGENILDPAVDVNALRARVGMVFQKPTPFPMSIYDNIAFGVKLFENLPRAEMDERVEWALKKAALWEEVKDKLASMGLKLAGDTGEAGPDGTYPEGTLNRLVADRLERLTEAVRGEENAAAKGRKDDA